MISAFGVDHGISKSLVNGQWVKATKLSGKQRKNVGGYKKAQGMTRAHKEYKTQMNQARTQLKSAPSEKVHGKGTIFGQRAPGTGGATVQLGSAKGGRTHIEVNAPKGTSKGKKKAIMAHERAHAAPKRSEYRVHGQIMKDPTKLMREEARADMARGAPGHYTKQAKNRKTFLGVPYGTKKQKFVSGYAGSAMSGNPNNIRRAYPHMSNKEATKNIKAYKDTQDKIARGQGSKTYKPPLTEAQQRKRIAIGAGAAAGTAGAGAGGVAIYNRKKKPHA